VAGDSPTQHCLVISAVNLTEGGPLTVLLDFMSAACRVLPREWRIIALVHERQLLASDRVEIIEIPYAKTSWLRRMRFEYFECRRLADRLRPDLWVALHDISPNVGNVRQVVYCHNPAPFYSLRLRDAFLSPTLLAFRVLYGLFYRINLNKNAAVIVQQSWLRDRFRRWTKPNVHIVVAHPVSMEGAATAKSRPSLGWARFFYPTLPRPFKNIELLCRAVAVLEAKPGWKSVVVVTISATENRYSRWLARKFGNLKSIEFVGRQSRLQMKQQYMTADCLLFPSRLETWGLPISEAKQMALPMFVADLPYAHETVGEYEQAEFVDVDDPVGLADKMLAFQDGKFTFNYTHGSTPAPPFAADWGNLVLELTAHCERKFQ
jgi:glycosyltransferase involved in cell wall biosynthesis